MISYDESVISYNKQAMNALRNDQHSAAFNLLSQAEEILKRKEVQTIGKLLSLTYNNFGCFYKRSGEYHLALKYFSKAINQENNDPVNQAGVLLNLCNVYSVLVNHPKALNSALKALEILRTIQDASDTYSFTLLTAYQSIAIEQENLSQYEVSKNFYKKALNLALKRFPDSRFVSKIRRRIEILLGKISACDGELMRESSRYRKRGFASLTPMPFNSKKKIEKMKVVPLTYTLIHKKVKKIERKLPLLSEHSLSGVPRRFIRKSIFKDKKKFDVDKGKNTDRVKTTLPSSRKVEDKSESFAKVYSKTPEILPVPYKNKLIFLS